MPSLGARSSDSPHNNTDAHHDPPQYDFNEGVVVGQRHSGGRLSYTDLQGGGEQSEDDEEDGERDVQVDAGTRRCVVCVLVLLQAGE